MSRLRSLSLHLFRLPGQLVLPHALILVPQLRLLILLSQTVTRMTMLTLIAASIVRHHLSR